MSQQPFTITLGPGPEHGRQVERETLGARLRVGTRRDGQAFVDMYEYDFVDAEGRFAHARYVGSRRP